MIQLRKLGIHSHMTVYSLVLLSMTRISFLFLSFEAIPENESTIQKGYRPISLLCHTYELYERMILNRISPTMEQRLIIKEQTGFRPGKSYTSQLLNLIEHIADGYQESIIIRTGPSCYALNVFTWYKNNLLTCLLRACILWIEPILIPDNILVAMSLIMMYTYIFSYLLMTLPVQV